MLEVISLLLAIVSCLFSETYWVFSCGKTALVFYAQIFINTAMVDREELEYSIKYPFTSKAKKIVEETGFNLEKPPIQVMDRAKQRVEENMSNSFELVKSNSEDTLLTELFSYPVSKILASLTKDYSVIKRYSKAESDRLHRELLKRKDPELLSELAEELEIQIKGGKIDFTVYVKASPEKHPLVNAHLHNGMVDIDDEILAEVIANTLKNSLAEELSKNIKVPKVYQDQAKKFRRDLRQTFSTEDLGPLAIQAFPPCIKLLIQDARAGEKMAHQSRFVLSTFLISVGMPVEQIVKLFSSTPNFNEKKTRYYVEYSAGKRGSRVKYSPPSCKKMEFYGLCKDKDILCGRVGHPLSYYARKKREGKK